MENVKIIKYVDKQQQTKRTMSKLSTDLCTYPQIFHIQMASPIWKCHSLIFLLHICKKN